MEKALKLFSDANIPTRPKDCTSTSWIESKMTRFPRTLTPKNDTIKLNLVHSDLSGPFPVPSYDFVTEMELQHHKTPKAFQTDNGGEYVTKDLNGFLNSKGIIHEFSPWYSPESNGVAEHPNRTIADSLKAILESALTYDKKSWAEAVLSSVYRKNRQPHLALTDQTPDAAFYSTKPSIQNLQPFGRKCYIDLPYQKQTDAMILSPNGTKGYVYQILKYRPAL